MLIFSSRTFSTIYKKNRFIITFCHHKLSMMTSGAMSKRSLKRREREKRKEHRFEDLKGLYGSSQELLGRIKKIERKGTKTATDYRNIDNLKERYEFMHTFEHAQGEKQAGKHDEKEKTISGSTKTELKLELKTNSVFYDPEINPLGEQPFLGMANLSVHSKNKLIKGQWKNLSNLSEIESEQISLPVEPKPKFYKLKQIQTQYQSADF